MSGSPNLILITGGARSGKSSHAQRIASSMGGGVLFVATAEALDEEMALRVKTHRDGRPSSWLTREEPLDPVKALENLPEHIHVVILDCLTLFVSNLLLQEISRPLEEIEADALSRLQTFLHRARGMGLSVIVVTNEVGMGVVPDNPLARNFRDLAGRAAQAVARQANEVFLMVAGVPITVKSPEGGPGR